MNVTIYKTATITTPHADAKVRHDQSKGCTVLVEFITGPINGKTICGSADELDQVAEILHAAASIVRRDLLNSTRIDT